MLRDISQMIFSSTARPVRNPADMHSREGRRPQRWWSDLGYSNAVGSRWRLLKASPGLRIRRLKCRQKGEIRGRKPMIPMVQLLAPQ